MDTSEGTKVPMLSAILSMLVINAMSFAMINLLAVILIQRILAIIHILMIYRHCNGFDTCCVNVENDRGAKLGLRKCPETSGNVRETYNTEILYSSSLLPRCPPS